MPQHAKKRRSLLWLKPKSSENDNAPNNKTIRDWWDRVMNRFSDAFQGRPKDVLVDYGLHPLEWESFVLGRPFPQSYDQSQFEHEPGANDEYIQIEAEKALTADPAEKDTFLAPSDVRESNLAPLSPALDLLRTSFETYSDLDSNKGQDLASIKCEYFSSDSSDRCLSSQVGDENRNDNLLEYPSRNISPSWSFSSVIDAYIWESNSQDSDERSHTSQNWTQHHQLPTPESMVHSNQIHTSSISEISASSSLKSPILQQMDHFLVLLAKWSDEVSRIV